MIPFLIAHYQEILQVLHIFVSVIQIIRNRRLQRILNNDNHIELIVITNMYFDQVMSWFEMVYSFLKFVRIHRRKRRLFKAHLLLQLLRGYRYP